MFIPTKMQTQKMKALKAVQSQGLPDHAELTERLRKTLYYGQMPETDRPSLPMTEITVEMLQQAAPRELGKVDEDWAASVSRQACMSPCSLMLGMIYIERLRHKNPEYLQKVSSSDLFLIAMMVASKYLYDEGVEEEVFNDEWAESASLETSEINDLERQFLAAIEWGLFVKDEDFESILACIERRIAWQESQRRGYFTYTDLVVLTEDKTLLMTANGLLQDMCKVALVCGVAYVAGTATIVGSVAALHCARMHAPIPSISYQPPPLSGISDNLCGLADIHSPLLVPIIDTWDGKPTMEDTTLFPGNQSSGGLGNVLQDLPSMDEDKKTDSGNTPSLPRSYHQGDPGTDEEIQCKNPARKCSRHSAPLTGNELGSAILHLPIHGFLTLALLKDTVMGFVSGLSTTSQKRNAETGSDQPNTEMDADDELECNCSCPNCPLKQPCQNETSPFQLPPRTCLQLPPTWELGDTGERSTLATGTERDYCGHLGINWPGYYHPKAKGEHPPARVTRPIMDIIPGFQTAPRPLLVVA